MESTDITHVVIPSTSGDYIKSAVCSTTPASIQSGSCHEFITGSNVTTPTDDHAHRSRWRSIRTNQQTKKKS